MTLEANLTINFMNKKSGNSKMEISNCKDLTPLMFKT